MAKRIRTFSRLGWFLALVLATTAIAADSPLPSGKVALESRSISVGVGVNWGDGTLNFKGNNYKFSIKGLTLVDFGFAKADAVGDVYNLTDPSMLGGTYVAAEAGFALAGGMGGMALRNQNGVILHLHSVTQGVKLQLGPSGFAITMSK
jgi:hypothetical protein